MGKGILSFSTKKVRVLNIMSFDNGSQMFSVRKHDFNHKSPYFFYKKVLSWENSNISHMLKYGRSRDVYFCYWVTEEEIMTDNRSNFGHNNQSTRKTITKTFLSLTYVRGELMTIRDAVNEYNRFGSKFSDLTKESLRYTISSAKFDFNNLKENELNERVIFIKGDGNKNDFFAFNVFKESHMMRPFPEKKLLPIKESL